MSRDALNAALIAAVEKLNATGYSWGNWGDEIASIALRRWKSFSRRRKKAKQATHEERVLDLAKGLQAHFEPDISYTPKSDWRYLAETLARQLQEGDD